MVCVCACVRVCACVCVHGHLCVCVCAWASVCVCAGSYRVGDGADKDTIFGLATVAVWTLALALGISQIGDVLHDVGAGRW
jgi:hypothetical protein